MSISVSLAVPYDAHPEQAFDVVVPDTQASDPSRALVICLHGGWWHQGHHQDLRALALALAEQGWAAASVGFRQLAAPGANPGPEHAKSGQDVLGDILLALPVVVEEARLLGWNGSSVVLLGSGSGSLLALIAASRLTLDRKPAVRVRAAIAVGVTPSLDHNDGWAPALGASIDRFAARDRHHLSPLHFTPHGFPPLLLLHGDKDIDYPATLAQKFHQKLTAADESSTIHILAGPGHHFVESPFSVFGRMAMERILAFLAVHAVEPS